MKRTRPRGEVGVTSFLTIESRKIEIQRHNNERSDRPWLIFLHEGLGCSAMWRDFPRRLSREAGCPALVYSRFGYGNSDPAPLPWKLNYMHKEALNILPKVIEAADIKEYILIGHSDGGSIGIIFSGSPVAKGLKGLITEAAHVFCEPLSVDSIAKAKISYEHHELKKGLEKYHGRNTDNAFYGWNGVWLNPRFMHFNIEKYLKSIKVPMLALQGRDDQYGTPKQLESIKTHVPQATTYLIDNCRHTPHFEQPEITMDNMVRFIETLIASHMKSLNLHRRT
ncbi:MAG: alpha/beta hydrolase [Pseudomonadota bacterium]